MVYAIQAVVFFRNAARRNNALSAINNRFGSAPQYGTPSASALTNRSDEPGLLAEARFTVQADRDAMWDELDALFGTGVNGPVTGSRVWRHDCPHDEGIGACTVGAERTW